MKNSRYKPVLFLTAILINSHSFHLIYFYCFSSTLTLSLAFNEEIFLSLHSQQGFAFKSALTIERGGGENECMHACRGIIRSWYKTTRRRKIEIRNGIEINPWCCNQFVARHEKLFHPHAHAHALRMESSENFKCECNQNWYIRLTCVFV